MTGPHRTNTRNWRDRAACRTEDPEIFFPVGETGPAQLQILEAQTVCRRCPVTNACFAWAIETGQEHGIWGASTEADRKNHRRRRRDAARKNGAAA